MNEVEKLLSEWKKLNTEEERLVFDEKMKSLIDSKPKEEMDIFANDFFNGAKKACEEAKDLIELVTMRQQLEPVIPYISLSTIAKEYFGKSRNWLYQRINGNIVNGKPAKFSDEERKTLKTAIEDITHKLQGVSISLN